MSRTIRLNEARRDVLRNALLAEIEALRGIANDDSESPEDKAYYGEQLKVAEDLLEKVR